MTTEELILLFLSYVTQNFAGHQPVDTADRNRMLDMVVQNHFTHCTASTCCHARKPTESLQISDKNMYADVLLNFLSHNSRLQGEVLENVVDPACEVGNTKLFNLKKSQYRILAQQMLKAYHTLAQNGHFLDLADESKLSDGHMLIDLPQDVCKRILFIEKSYAEKLKNESKAEMVVIRRRPYKDSLAGLVLEAWGSCNSLRLIRYLISDEEKVKASLFSAGVHRCALENAHMTVFQKCSSASSKITFVEYSGPCQPNHDKFKLRHVPRLIQTDPADSSFSVSKFVDRSLQQIDLINDNYDETVHGKIRAVVSYGTFYIANCVIKEVPENEFDDLLFNQTVSGDAIHPRGRARGRTARGRGSGPNNSVQRRCHSSFIPTANQNIDKARLEAFLQKNGFVVAEDTVDYRVLWKLNVSRNPLKLEAVVVLDEDFNLKYMNMPDFKWLYVNVVSADKGDDYRPYDWRVKIQSRSKRNVLQLRQESTDFADVVSNHHVMLLRNNNKDVYGVHSDFKTRINFVRKRHTVKYQLEASRRAATMDAFLYGTAIEVNYVTEYSRPSKAGIFQKVDDKRVEITAIPELPDLHDKDKMRTFFSRTWEFAEELGSILG